MVVHSSPITIAIDGYSGCGKSTTAKGVAQRLGFLYIDSGSMYRAVTLYFLRNQIPFQEVNPQMLAALNEIQIDFVINPETGFPEVQLNAEAVEKEIRKPEVADAVSQVSVHPPVRKAMVAIQQKIGERGGIVMDGRDIGTVVFPHAELKVFMTANIQVRAMRRQEELAKKGIVVTKEEIETNLKTRDVIDSTREQDPLRKAADAREIDTSEISVDDQIEWVCKWANEIMAEKVAHL